MRLRILPALLLAAAVLLALPAACRAPGGEAAGVPEAGEVLEFARGGTRVTEEADRTDGFSVQRRVYALYNGDEAVMGRAEAPEDLGPVSLAALELPAGAGTVRWFDAAADAWIAAPLAEAVFKTSCAVVTLEAGGEYLLYTPKLYQDQGFGTVRYLRALDGALTVEASEDGWRLTLTAASLPTGCEADYMTLASQVRLFENPAVLDSFWRLYTLDGDGKWRYDGYYYPSPATYTPSGEDCLYRLPAAYLCKSFVYGASKVRAAEDLAVATLDVMARQQSLYGYFPTLPESQWLSEDYGIGPGFYDTRFNTELVEIYLRYIAQNPCEAFTALLDRYFDFYLDFATVHHRETEHGGWLVDDYWHPDGGRGTHTSLNHQLAELLALYHGADSLDRPELRALADRMLRAVQDTAPSWVRADGDLHYACYPDGSYGGSDYPYLTYNDLYHLREYLPEPVPELEALMEAKRAWMDRSGVTGYLQ